VLAIYRRHRSPCRFTSRRFRKCTCPIWVQGSLRGEYVRRSLDLRSWEAAAGVVRDWEASGEIGVVKPEVPTVAEAAGKFLEDAQARHLTTETVRKYRHLLERRFVAWCESKGYRLLKQIDVGVVREFRAAWQDGAIYAAKNLERMRAFFRFCEQARWIERNPAVGVKPPKVKLAPTLPFSADEMMRIVEACDRYPGNAGRMKAFVLTMRHSGLRIGDTIALKRERLKGNRLFLYTQKTGTPVCVPLPPVTVDALCSVESGGEYFFTSGHAKRQTARANWSRYLGTVFELAGVRDAHSHRFRDTFAVSLLENGVSIENVSVLLGHSSVRITERHYKPWVKTLQMKLEEEVRKTWT
jgi:integrase/recombinase XerD